MPQFRVRGPLTSRAAPGREWFVKGSEAFRRAFPTLAAEVPRDQFWVCPLCLHAFGEDALEARFLTREHVPPRSVGGKRMTLTCGPCNWEPDQVTDTLHAYQLSKRGNSLRVMAEAVRWARRGARINTISPGIIITPLAKDELSGPRGEGYRRMIELSPARRAGTPDEWAPWRPCSWDRTAGSSAAATS
jgi:NAD(P)-dependent dehydrogenase (short-subunit alcohol dehydrogenase family)